MATANGSQPSAPQVKLKTTEPKVPKKRKKMPSSATDGTDPPLPSETEEDGGDEFQEVISRRANKPRHDRDRQIADKQAGTTIKSLFSSVYLEATDKRKLNDFAVARALRQGKIEFVKVISKGLSQVLIHFNTKGEAENFSNNQVFLQSVKCTAKVSQGAPDSIKGVIRGIDTDITEDEMKDELGKSLYYTVVSVKRLSRTDQNKERIPTTTVLIEFKGNTLPRAVCMYNVSRSVQIYVIKPTICFNCHLYGHIAIQCQSTRSTCGFCAGAHNTRDCDKKKETDAPTCVNCNGPHVARSTECPVMRHKFESRMESSLRTTQFQQIPSLLSTNDFPSIAATPSADSQRHQEGQAEQPQEPRTLPPRAQKKAVKKFSHALLNRYTNDQQKHEIRQNRYQNLIQIAEERTQRSNASPRQREDPTREQDQPQHEPRRRAYRREPTPTHTEMNFDNVISYLTTSQSALTSLLAILQVLLTTSVPRGDHLDPRNVKLIQQKLLRLRPTRKPSQRDPARQSESEVFMEAEDTMESD
jgi:hypothetical protein